MLERGQCLRTLSSPQGLYLRLFEIALSVVKGMNATQDAKTYRAHQPLTASKTPQGSKAQTARHPRKVWSPRPSLARQQIIPRQPEERLSASSLSPNCDLLDPDFLGPCLFEVEVYSLQEPAASQPDKGRIYPPTLESISASLKAEKPLPTLCFRSVASTDVARVPCSKPTLEYLRNTRTTIVRTLVCEPTSWISDPSNDGQTAVQNQTQTETDEDLLRRLQAKEPEALAQLWERYSGLLFTQALGVLHNPAEAEDIVVEVFAEVWRRAANYHPERARPAAWLVTLVRRRSIDKLRERRSYEKAGVRLALEIETTKLNSHCGFEESGTDGVEEQVYLSELRRLLENALSGLPERQRETVSLAYFQGLTQREIAARTCTPLGTVKTRLELGLRKMRERIRVAQLRSKVGAPNP